MSNEAKTSKITRIVDIDGMEEAKGIAYDNHGKVLFEQTVDCPILNIWNSNPDIERVDIFCDLTWIDRQRSGRLVLYDTPGPNYSGDISHRSMLESFIDGNSEDAPDVVLFIMDFTKLRVFDDQKLLFNIINKLGNEGFELNDRFIFVVNRIDELRSFDGLLSDVVTRHRDYLTDTFNLESPNIHPISASAALLSRMRLNGTAFTDEDDIDYSRLKRMNKHIIPSSWQCNNPCFFPVINNDDEAIRLIQSSGLYNLQKTLIEFLKHISFPMKINRAIRWFNRVGMINFEMLKEMISKDPLAFPPFSDYKIVLTTSG